MNDKEVCFDQTQYLTFHLAGEEYAVGILQVKEIITYGTLTKVPHTPASIRGVINLRGNVVPVVDLGVKFGLAASPVTDRTCIVIVEADINDTHTVMGVVADSVSQVISMAGDSILPAPSFGTQVRMEFLRGMGKSGDKFVLVLDIDKVLGADDLAPVTAGLNARESTAEAEL
ncbi:MAG: chemotaxis protein CheW [Candidatus Binatia bacterium]